ncbi:MFS transporter [Nocardioides aurantiacus]|uniref:MFS transporter n=1 Tax=Nocardioides aurantiacus TaxID=86796 RepID=UPI00403F5166
MSEFPHEQHAREDRATVPTPDGTGAPTNRWLALLVCCSALFMTLLDVSITNVALPSISDATGAGPAELQWIVSGYTLAFGLVPVLAGRLGDDHGRKLMFQVGVVGFAVTSAVAGLAPTPELLIAARVLQGVAGGLINPQVSGLVQQMFRGEERGRAFGALGTTVGVGVALGPMVGGLLIAVGGPELGWRLVFFVNVPIALVVLVLARRLLPETPSTGRHRLDVLGSLVLGAATFCVLFAAVELEQLGPVVLVLLVPAALLMAGFYRRERRLTRARLDPLVDLRLFRQPSYTSGVVLALLYFPAQAGIPLVLTLYFQRGLGYSALHTALAVTAFAVGSAVAAQAAGRFVTRVGRPLTVLGTAVFGVGGVSLAVAAHLTSPEHAAYALAVPLFLMGVGNGAVITPNQALTLAEVDPVVGSTAGGVLQTAQRVGLAVGQAVIGAAFFAAVAGTGPTAYAAALAVAVGVSLCFVLAATAVGVLEVVRERRTAAR